MAYLNTKGIKTWRKKNKWRKLKGTVIVSIIAILVAAFFGYQNYNLSLQANALNERNFEQQNYFPSLYSYYGVSELDKSIASTIYNSVIFYGNVSFNLDASTPHSSIVAINSVSLNFSFGDSMGVLDLSKESYSYATFFGRTSYQYVVSPSSPKISDNVYVQVILYLTPKNYTEYPITINFPIGELVFNASITDRTNNQVTNTQFKEGIRGQIEFLS